MQPIGTNIWHVPGRPLRMPGGVWMPLASTVIRLPDRSLVVYSPVEFDDDAAAALGEVGDVGHLIVPSRLHHMFAASAATRWPRAQVYAAPALRSAQLRVDHDLSQPVAAWQAVLDVARVGGAPRIDEHVAFHRPSGTLICSDLLFHITRPAN